LKLNVATTPIQMRRFASTQPPPPATSSKPSVSQIFAQYGVIGMGVYGSISMAGFGAIYAAMATGLLDTNWLIATIQTHTSVEKWSGINLTELDPRYANFGLAYCANFFLEPVRIFGTVAFTPMLGRWWMARRQLQPSPPQQQPPVQQKVQETQSEQKKSN
jgi:hypothetical protein